MSREIKFTNLTEALGELDRIEKNPPALDSSWSLARVLTHCAQSIEYSMHGFPAHKSIIVRRFIGPLVFKRFAGKGAMNHNLTDPIPGAPEIDNGTDLAGAAVRLRKAVADFQAFSGEPREHFAFGKLNKEQYELAHAMHIANHFSQMS